jgi:demethylmenaquinone methyltransferase/2-methoxy-6-polyprenyl-1,4-benzoquinol methylase
MNSGNSIQSRDGSGEMFDGIAARYDLLNRVMSLGMDRHWRRVAARGLELKTGHRVLDLATGTADLAIEIARRERTVRVVGLDPSTRMLAVGREKIERSPFAGRIELVEGDAQNLPFEADSFDGLTMAFGIRNVPDRPKALREMSRVVRPNGRICILELSEPSGGLLGRLAQFYVHVVVPTLGSWLSGAREYKYLQRSIAAFPKSTDFAAIMDTADLRVLRVVPLGFGACHLYVASPKER